MLGRLRRDALRAAGGGVRRRLGGRAQVDGRRAAQPRPGGARSAGEGYLQFSSVPVVCRCVRAFVCCLLLSTVNTVFNSIPVQRKGALRACLSALRARARWRDPANL